MKEIVKLRMLGHSRTGSDVVAPKKEMKNSLEIGLCKGTGTNFWLTRPFCVPTTRLLKQP